MNLKSQYRYPEIVIQILTLKNWTRKRPKHLVISYKQCEKHMWIISYKLYRNPSILSRSILLPVRDDLFHVRDIYSIIWKAFCFVWEELCFVQEAYCARTMQEAGVLVYFKVCTYRIFTRQPTMETATTESFDAQRSFFNFLKNEVTTPFGGESYQQYCLLSLCNSSGCCRIRQAQTWHI